MISLLHFYRVGSCSKSNKPDVQPPDLWIHHDHLELKNFDKGERSNSPNHAAIINHTGWCKDSSTLSNFIFASFSAKRYKICIQCVFYLSDPMALSFLSHPSPIYVHVKIDMRSIKVIC